MMSSNFRPRASVASGVKEMVRDQPHSYDNIEGLAHSG